MADKISPEEKLFKIIREGKKDGAKPLSGPRGIKRFFASLSFDRKRCTARPNPAQAAISGAPAAFSITLSEIKPKTVNTLLAIILAGITALVIYVTINERPRVATIVERVSMAPAEPVKTGAIEAFKPMSFYLTEVKKREIFQPVPMAKPVAQKPDPQKVVLDKLKEISTDFRLQGISWGQNPRAMIKSEKENKMYFLGEGQVIGSTGVKVKSIYKDKIVISYENSEMELL